MLPSPSRSCFCLFMLTFFLPLKLFAWNALGHMVVTEIAYERLTPVAKQKVDKLVEFFAKEYPKMPTLLHMAVWPDAVRSQRIDTFTRWHYIDVPFSADSTPLADTISTDNAEWALNTIKNVVRNDHANDYERARFLAFTIHIVGDLHQPLHTVTRITSAHPEGDRGGNLFYVQSKRSRVNIHKIWDEGVGSLLENASEDEAKALAKILTERYPESQFNGRANIMDTNVWKNEGMNNATTYVYNTKEDELLSTEYVNAGRNVAEEQLALAGYRLANLLNTLLS